MKIRYLNNRFRQTTLLALLLCFVLLLVTACGAGLEEKKSESETHYKLGVVYLNDRNFIMALEEFTQAIEVYPEEPSYHNAIGLAYFARDMNAKAKRHMEQAIALQPDFSEAYVNLAAIHLVERNWEAAIDASNMALGNIFYKTPELAHFNIAQAHYNMGKYERAAEGFVTAAKLNPRYVPAFYNLGLTYEKLKRTKEAVKAYRRVISISPGYVEAYFKLGMLLVKSGEKRSATEVFNSVIKLAPGSAEAKSASEYIELLK
ncbi:MAG: tetratricopeptide repeat protein [Proteobacteria bacterium]|nr:tetratricopeptide repeat protein [Pseudomonadota bacterium]